MEQLYYNLSEEEFTKGRKILLWIFASLFFIAGLYVVTAKPLFGHESIAPILSTAPFGISLIVFLFAALASIKRSDLFFLVDYGKIEFRYGIINAKRHIYQWNEIKEICMPLKQRKIKLILKDGTSYVIDLTYLQRRKSTIIYKHIYQEAREQGLNIIKVQTLS
jgi:hypothetical protein